MTADVTRDAGRPPRETVEVDAIAKAMAERERLVLKAVYTRIQARPMTVVVLGRQKKSFVVTERSGGEHV